MANYRFVTEEDLMGLPRGFRFHPTDEELIVHYLVPKATNSNFSAAAMGQADFNKCEPWDLPKKANMGDAERYFYCQRDRKYPTGQRTNRATKAGYWKATGKDKEIYKGMGNRREIIGMKKTLVFYTGRAPKGEKTNWVMHEFRLHPQFQFSHIPKNEEWVISRVVHKTTGCGGDGGDGMHKKPYNRNYSFSPIQRSDSFISTDELFRDDDFESLPPLIDPAAPPEVPQLQNHLIYSENPAYYHSETLLFQTSEPCGYVQQPKNKSIDVGSMEELKCKVEQHCASSAVISFSQDIDITLNNDVNNGEISSIDRDYEKFLSPTLGSMLDLSALWDC
ncbi:unnamed protein product [Rhodiola kirilowii]